MKINELTAHQLLDLSLSKTAEFSSQTVYDSLSAQIQKYDNRTKAFIRVYDKENQEPRSSEKIFPAPIAIKDNICIAGEEVTCCSRILQGFRSPYDATVIKKLKQVGIPILGHTNMDEFAFGSSTENSCYGPTRNPWNFDYVPGGSSGGSAAAVAAHEAIWALGSDTGGSIRQPASFCGVVGLKPTYGRVSRFGLIAFASSLDQIGPITKDVTDAALLLEIIAGHDPQDSTSVDMPVPDYRKALINDVKGLKLGIPKEFFIDGLDKEVKESIMAAIEVFRKCGATFEEISLPHMEYAVATYYIVATAEASSNLARFDGVQYGLRKFPSSSRINPIVDMYEETRDKGLGTEAKRRIMLGTYCLSSGYYDDYYLRGLKVRTLIKSDFDKVFEEFDAVITPTSPTAAFKIGEKISDPLAMYLSDIYTISANLSGLPAISIPCGFSKNRLPIGLQIMGKNFDEESLLRIAYTYEQNTPWHKEKINFIR